MGVDYSGIPNKRDKKIRDVVDKYGKKDGVYQNPTKLIQNLPRASNKINSVNKNT